ncbi:PREDICTED: uncharacterized protein LOC106817600 [Priapulus caudatus]|uniref:Uncharacterized protein LOC106817600 n=1 Tax=Priapulus caudatus TaxID=37621 RepID=A0ABM1EZZ5_PRICU|nr:PREDICTED: uncharacterized protein LOC106817600 [Priapulus caudatus]
MSCTALLGHTAMGRLGLAVAVIVCLAATTCFSTAAAAAEDGDGRMRLYDDGINSDISGLLWRIKQQQKRPLDADPAPAEGVRYWWMDKRFTRPMRYHHFYYGGEFRPGYGDPYAQLDRSAGFIPAAIDDDDDDDDVSGRVVGDTLDKKTLFGRSRNSRGRGRGQGTVLDPAWSWAGLGRRRRR